MGLGANLGDREGTIRAALDRLAATPGVRVAAVSRLIDTAPVGGPPGQPRFLNGAARLETTLPARALLERLLAIERELGRARAERWGPRTIDLDLLLYGERAIDEPDLVVPHPRMRERPFVLGPLAELGMSVPAGSPAAMTPRKASPPGAAARLLDGPAAVREVVREARRAGKTIGFVPTMGALHEGHVSLARRARAENDVVIVSIFVNPLQFGPSEDFARYPRDLDGDRRLLAEVPVDAIFTAGAEAMFPKGYLTYVVQDELPEKLEGKSRPGHFRGVLTVVLKLLALTAPDRAYFGQKDLQQTVVLRRMVVDLNLDLALVVCPTVREPDGLAMSSRNRYLSAEDRKDALALSRGLLGAKALFEAGERRADALRAAIRAALAQAPGVRVDYAEIVGPETLDPVATVADGDAAVIAAYVGSTRLIDNVVFGS